MSFRLDCISSMRNSGNHAMKEKTSRWREWLREHGPKLLLFARQQTRRQEDAEDILQEALVKLARKVDEGSFVGGQGAWMPFLYTQVRREAIDLGRRNDRRKKREEAVSPEDEVLQPESTARLDVAFLLSRLGPPCNELLERVYLDGASYPTLAAELDLAESSVRAKVSRCLRRARELAEAA